MSYPGQGHADTGTLLVDRQPSFLKRTALGQVKCNLVPQCNLVACSRVLHGCCCRGCCATAQCVEGDWSCKVQIADGGVTTCGCLSILSGFQMRQLYFASPYYIECIKVEYKLSAGAQRQMQSDKRQLQIYKRKRLYSEHAGIEPKCSRRKAGPTKFKRDQQR